VVNALAKYGYTPIISMCQYTKTGLNIEEIMDSKKFIEQGGLDKKIDNE
jgi:hypothetical protein